jgi:hypothetical protein
MLAAVIHNQAQTILERSTSRTSPICTVRLKPRSYVAGRVREDQRSPYHPDRPPAVNYRVYVLGADLNSPAEVRGELYTGRGLARGYLGERRLAERFATRSGPGSRMYRTETWRSGAATVRSFWDGRTRR